MDLNGKIAEMVHAHLGSPSHFLVDVVVKGSYGPKKVLVIIDGDEGVTIEDCAHLSRELSGALDKADLIDENYTLEVSTPGVDFPLKLKRQYVKNIGRGFKIVLKDKTVIKGKLKEVSDDSIRLEVEEKEDKKKTILKTVPVQFDNIDKALVQVSFK